MSYYDVPPSDYFEGPAGTPGWQMAPVPGWGTNPMRAGPPRVGVGRLGDTYEPGAIWEEEAFEPQWAAISGLGADPSSAYNETSWGMVALSASAGISFGLLFGYAYWGRKKAS